MEKLILHIGWPKSGTSSIQGKLASNTEQLGSLGFLYPAIERSGDAHHPACGLFIDHQDPLIPPPKGDLNDLVQYCDGQEHQHMHTAILSSEGFCRADSIQDKATQLTNHFNVTVLACVREPLVWANSLMNQLLKMRLFFGESIDMDSLANEMILRDFHHANRLCMWSDAFGKSNVQVVALNEGEDFSKAFFDAVGIDAQVLTNEPVKDGLNKSLGLGSLQFINWICRQKFQLSQPQKIALNNRLHDCPVIETPNVLNQQLCSAIFSQRSQIKDELTNNWLGGERCFLAEPAIAPFGNSKLLDNIDLEEIATCVLWDDMALLDTLRNELR